MRNVIILSLFILVSLTWGTTWLAMRIAADTIPPLFATGMRFTFAAPFLNRHCLAHTNTAAVPARTALFSVHRLSFLFRPPLHPDDLWRDLG